MALSSEKDDMALSTVPGERARQRLKRGCGKVSRRDISGRQRPSKSRYEKERGKKNRSVGWLGVGSSRKRKPTESGQTLQAWAHASLEDGTRGNQPASQTY